jgi:hypothetical protein
VFGLGLSQRRNGTLELSSVSFEDLTNTRTVTAATLSLFYWEELTGASEYRLSAGVTAEEVSIQLNDVGPATVGSYVQIGREVLRVIEVAPGGLGYSVERGAHGSLAAAHDSQTAVYHLTKKVGIVPFVEGFFGSPASGTWGHQIPLPNTRVASAELFVTNGRGNSPTAVACYTQNLDSGLRTLSGGQFSMQVDGFLAIDAAAAPVLVMDAIRSVRDVFAVVRQAPAGGGIQLRLTQNGTLYCELTIAEGATMSNVVDGFALAPLASGTRLNLDVRAVGASWPGSDLTVVIRL